MSLRSDASQFAATMTLQGRPHRFIDLRAAAGGTLETLPWCIRVLLENTLRTSEPEAGEAALAAILQADRHGG